MTIKVRSGGTLRQAVGVSIATGGMVKRARTIKQMRGGTLTLVYTDPVAPMSAVCSPTTAHGTNAAQGPSTVTAGPVTATVTGGTAPFTYAWAILSFTGDVVSITAPSSASTTFRQGGEDSENTASARCTVTDANRMTVTCDVGLTFDQINVNFR